MKTKDERKKELDDLKRAELDVQAENIGIDPSKFSRMEDLAEAILEKEEKAGKLKSVSETPKTKEETKEGDKTETKKEEKGDSKKEATKKTSTKDNGKTKKTESKTEIPSYESTKKVKALKIKEVRRNSNGTAEITPKEKGFDPFVVDAHYMRRFNARAGGYYVEYEDGSKSYQTAEHFESGYKKMK
jgi:hypothetical protein